MRSSSRRCGLALLVPVLALSVDRASGQITPHGPEFQVNTYTSGVQRVPHVAVGSDGGFLVVWQSDGSLGTDTDRTSVHAQKFDAGGVPVGAELQLNTYTTDDQGWAAVAPLASGGFVVAWVSEGSAGSDTSSASIQARLLDATGQPVGQEFQVNSETTGFQFAPAVAAGGQGGFVVSWSGPKVQQPSEMRVSVRRFAADGTPLGPELPANSNQTGSSVVSSVAVDDEGGFVVAWGSTFSTGSDQSSNSIQARRFGVDGLPLGSEFQVNTFTVGSQSNPSVATGLAGEFVVGWVNSDYEFPGYYVNSIRAQRFEASGSALGAELEVTPEMQAFPHFPSVASDRRGGFVVAWAEYQELLGGDTDSSIQARSYRADGTPSSGPVQINNLVIQRLSYAKVVVDSDGNPTFVWDSRGYPIPNQLETSIRARRFDALFRDGFESGDESRWSAVESP